MFGISFFLSFIAVPPEITAVINVVHTKLMINAQLECVVSLFFNGSIKYMQTCVHVEFVLQNR